MVCCFLRSLCCKDRLLPLFCDMIYASSLNLRNCWDGLLPLFCDMIYAAFLDFCVVGMGYFPSSVT